VTSVFVTHDQEEAMEVADRIIVMNQGRVEQDGAPDDVYDHPASPFVLQFLGDVNLFRGRLDASPAAAGESAVAYVRPHELQVVGQAESGSVPVTLEHALTVGPNTRLEFRRSDDDSYVDVEMPRAEYLRLRERLGLRPGATVHLLPRRVTRFASEDVDPAAMI
jgi:sulfate transport system ATP-binding protein